MAADPSISYDNPIRMSSFVLRHVLFVLLLGLAPSGVGQTAFVVVVPPAATAQQSPSRSSPATAKRSRLRRFWKRHRRALTWGFSLVLYLGYFLPGLNGILLAARLVRGGLRLFRRLRELTRDSATKGPHGGIRHFYLIVGIMLTAIGTLLLITGEYSSGRTVSTLFAGGSGWLIAGLVFLLIALTRYIRRSRETPDGIRAVRSERAHLRGVQLSRIFLYLLITSILLSSTWGAEVLSTGNGWVITGIIAVGFVSFLLRLLRRTQPGIAAAATSPRFRRRGVLGTYATRAAVPTAAPSPNTSGAKRSGPKRVLLIVLIFGLSLLLASWYF